MMSHGQIYTIKNLTLIDLLYLVFCPPSVAETGKTRFVSRVICVWWTSDEQVEFEDM